MEKIKVIISWSGENYSATSASEEINGVVIVTNKKLEEVKKDFSEALQFHIESCLSDGDLFPHYLVNGNYNIDFELDTSALLHSLDGVLTRSALSRVTGINERQLGHYFSGLRKPRPEQREKIIQGIHTIGESLIAVG